MEQKKIKNASLIRKLKSKPQRLLITILIGNNVVNLFTASYATVVAISFFGSAGLGIATGVTTFFILIFGEIMPKSVAFANNMRIARLTAKPLYALFIVLYPVSHVLLMLNRATNRIFKSPTSRGVSEEEIRVMSRLGVESGAIDYREHEMIENIFKFDDVLVGEIMTPISRTEILNGSVPVEQIAHFVCITQRVFQVSCA
jgi:Mg2+/Co2+ transporter CorB